MKKMHIPLTKPYWRHKEETAAISAMRRTSGTGDGPNTAKLIEQLKTITGAAYVLPVTSCTHGLELAVRALGIKGGDEVIMPSFTLSSTANSVVLAGGKPVFADIDPTHFNIDPDDIKRKITPRTRAITVVHYAGMACRMDEILEIAKIHKLAVIEDAAHAIGVTYKGKALGTWGDAGVYSFHGTKNVSCGEGGAVLTGRKDLADRMEIFRANGTNRKAFLEGTVDRYSWVSVGTSFFLSDILAAVTVAQLSGLGAINVARARIAAYYAKHLETLDPLVRLPVVTPQTHPNWHIYAVLMPSHKVRTDFIRWMRKKGIEVSYHYVPLHSSPMGTALSGGRVIPLPVTTRIAGTLVRLPIYPGLSDRRLSYIVTSVRKVMKEIS